MTPPKQIPKEKGTFRCPFLLVMAVTLDQPGRVCKFRKKEKARSASGSRPLPGGRGGQFRLRASAKGWWRRSIARAKLWQANEFAFGKLGQYRAESDHKAERDPRTQASRACPFAEKEEQGSGRMASFSPKAKKKPEQSGLCSDVVPVVGVEPTRYHYHRILSPARLPIPPYRRI